MSQIKLWYLFSSLQLGKYMKLKLQYTQPPNSLNKPTPKQDKSSFEKKDSSKLSHQVSPGSHLSRPQLPRHLSLTSGAPPPAMSPSLPRRSHSLTGTEVISGLGWNSNQKGASQRTDSPSGISGDPLNAWKVNSAMNSHRYVLCVQKIVWLWRYYALISSPKGLE